MRKNTQALTAREKPNAKAIYNRFEVFGAVETVAAEDTVFATWVPEKAKNKNMNVPTNSPRKATK